jgi:two-component system, NarL family, nitrate/nitrite response regulator NarL
MPALLQTIESVERGELLCTPRVAASLLHRVQWLSRYAQPAPAQHLTYREREVLQLIDQGFSNKEIARALSIELGTVKNHVHNILNKLKVARRSEAARWARLSTPARRATP